MRTVAVIGKNFGDEGKGLACASLSFDVPKTLIIKHNGGGQAGHTVETKQGKRFIHHQIGSGAEYGADTLLSESFYPDLFQLDKELKEFKETYGFTPRVYGEKSTKITVIDDVLRNMFIEASRGDSRHGSCGMGINECKHRHLEGFLLTLEDVKRMSEKDLFNVLLKFRKEYGQRNIDIIKAEYEKNNSGKSSEYYDMLRDDTVLLTYAEYIKESIENVVILDADREWLTSYDQIVFETGQGLLLDEGYETFAPFLTPSKTGLNNVAAFLEKRDMALDEAIYVTRSYVTRHGNGPLSCEVQIDDLPGVCLDATNIHNEWQGNIRYARHENIEAFVGPVIQDVKSVSEYKSVKDASTTILVTHLNETSDKIYFRDSDISFDELKDVLTNKYLITKVYGSYSKYGFAE